jgi:catechol 2,3-dioxygenase-like lactoylglutathione lyase family enzyme
VLPDRGGGSYALITICQPALLNLRAATATRGARRSRVTVELNHIIVPARNKQASAEFLAGILGVEVGPPFGPFAPVRVGNGVTLDFEAADDFNQHHCAFLVDEAEFGAVLARIQASGAKWYADPFRNMPDQVNELFGGRGVYFDDPDGHLMEVLTWVIPHTYWQSSARSS